MVGAQCNLLLLDLVVAQCKLLLFALVGAQCNLLLLDLVGTQCNLLVYTLVGALCNLLVYTLVGAQCNLETVENIVWARTPAITNATVPCPGQEERRARNETYGNPKRTLRLLFCFTLQEQNVHFSSFSFL